MGRKKVKFPGKRKQWFGKGVLMWWEDNRTPCKKTSRQKHKKEILENLE